MSQYRGFKKVAEDAHSATMRHENGHELKIVKKSLSGKLLKQLSSLEIDPNHGMAKGGEVQGSEDKAKAIENGFNNATAQGASPSPQKGAQKPPQRFADGTEEPIEPSQEENAMAGQPEASNAISSTMPAPGAEKELLKGVAKQEQGIQDLAQSEHMKADALTNTLGNAQVAEQNAQEAQTGQYNDLLKRHASLLKGREGATIDPHHYVNSQGWSKRVATGIGLVLGGIGSGFAGGENPVLAHLNKEIDRDIESQKDNIHKQDSLLADNLKQLGDMREAMAMTKAQRQGALAIDLQKAAAQAATPEAAARAKIEAGKLHVQAANTLQAIAAQRTARQAQLDERHYQHNKDQEAIAHKREEEAKPENKQVEEINDIDTSINGVKALLRDVKPEHVGFLDSKIPDILSSKETVAFRGEVGRVADAYRRFVTGQGASAQELSKLESRLPKDSDTLTNFKAKAKSFLREVEDKKTQYLGNLEKQGKNVSKFKSSAPSAAEAETIERMDPKSGKIVIFDAATKKPLRFK